MPKFEKVTCRILNRQSRSPAWSGPCSARWPVWTPWCGRAAAPRLSPRGSLSPYTCHHFRGEFILKNWTTNLTDWLKPSIFGGTPRRLINGHTAKKINGSECDFSFKQSVQNFLLLNKGCHTGSFSFSNCVWHLNCKNVMLWTYKSIFSA